MIISPDLRPCKAASDWLCYLVMNYERVTVLEDRGRPQPQSHSQTSALTACFPRRFLDTELCIRCAPNSRAVRHDASHSVWSILAAGACAGEQTLRAPRSPARAFVSFHPTPSRARGLRAGVAGIRPEWGLVLCTSTSVRADFAGSHRPAPLPSGASIWRSRYPSPHTAHR